MKIYPLPLLLLGLLAWPAARACADVVVLTNGVKMEGILTTSEDAAIALQVSDGGYVVLDTSTIVEIRKQSAALNARLKSKWSEQDLQASTKEREARKFSQQQRAKGLILYDGEWVTPAEFDRQLALVDLDVQRSLTSYPSIGQVKVGVSVNETSDPGVSSYYYHEPHYRKRRYSTSEAPTRISGFSSSGNFIRRSEFVHPDPHPDAHYFDPSTGLYR